MKCYLSGCSGFIPHKDIKLEAPKSDPENSSMIKSFIPMTTRDWNSLPSTVFPVNYNPQLKAEILLKLPHPRWPSRLPFTLSFFHTHLIFFFSSFFTCNVLFYYFFFFVYRSYETNYLRAMYELQDCKWKMNN